MSSYLQGKGGRMKTILTSLILLLSIMSVSAADHVVTIENFAFNPAQLTVKQGDTIEFINRDRAPHNVIPRENSLTMFSSSPILNTEESFIMEVTGSDDILAHCGVHPRMPGIEINVESVSQQQMLLNDIRLRLDELDKLID